MIPQTATNIWSVFGVALDRGLQGIAYIDNGCAPTAGVGLAVSVAAGDFLVNSGSTLTNTVGGSVTPTAAHATLPRRDLVYFSSAGTLTVTAGTAAALDVVVPPALPAGAALVAVLFIAPAAIDYSAGFPTSGIADHRIIRQRGAIDGTVAAPGWPFAADTDTGLHRSAANTIDVVTGGVRAAQFSTVASAVNYLDVVPSIATANTLVRAEGTDTNISIELVPKGTGAVVGPVGAEATPAFTFTGDQDTGIYRTGANALAVTAGGVQVAPLAIATATVAGFVPTPPNNTTTFLRGDATFAVAGFTVGARVTNAATQLIGTGAWTSLAFNTERYDTDVIHDTVTNNSRLTCKTAGKYVIKGQAALTAPQASLQTRLFLNGVTEIAHWNPGQGALGRWEISTIYDLAVNDYVEFQIFHSLGSDVTVDKNANSDPEFMMQRVG